METAASSSPHTPLHRLDPFDLPSTHIFIDSSCSTSQTWSLHKLSLKSLATNDTARPLAEYAIRPRLPALENAHQNAVPVKMTTRRPCDGDAGQLQFITHRSATSHTRDASDANRAGHFEPLPADSGDSSEEDDAGHAALRHGHAPSSPSASSSSPSSSLQQNLLLKIESTSSGVGVRLRLKRKAAATTSPTISVPSSPSFSQRSRPSSPPGSPRGPRPPSSHTRGWSFSASDSQTFAALRQEQDPPRPQHVLGSHSDSQLLFVTCTDPTHLSDFVRDITSQAQRGSEVVLPTEGTTGQADGDRFAALQSAKNVIETHAGRLTCEVIDLDPRDSKDAQKHATKRPPSDVVFATRIVPSLQSSELAPGGHAVICALVELHQVEKTAKIAMTWQFWMSAIADQATSSATMPDSAEVAHSFAHTPLSTSTQKITFPRSDRLSSADDPLASSDAPNASTSAALPAPLLASLDRTELVLEEMEADSPLVRAAFANLDKRTQALKKACKTMLKCTSDVKANMAALQASESGLDECFKALGSALTPGGFEAVATRSIAEERTRSAKMRDEQLRCLHEFVELPIKALLDLCRKAQDLHAAFESESKTYYAATQKWLSKSSADASPPAHMDANGNPDHNARKQDKGHDKQRTRDLHFLLARLELFDAFTCLHGGQAEIDMASSALASHARLNHAAVNLWTGQRGTASSIGMPATEAFIPSLQAERHRISAVRFACGQRIADVQAQLAADDAAPLEKSRSAGEQQTALLSGGRHHQQTSSSASPDKVGKYSPADADIEGSLDKTPPVSFDPELFPDVLSPVSSSVQEGQQASPQNKKQRLMNMLGSIGTSPAPPSAQVAEDESVLSMDSPQRQQVNFKHLKQKMAGRLHNTQLTAAAALKAKNKWRSGSAAPTSNAGIDLATPDLASTSMRKSMDVSDTPAVQTGVDERSPRLSLSVGSWDRPMQPLQSVSGKRISSLSNAKPPVSSLEQARPSEISAAELTAPAASPKRAASLSIKAHIGQSGQTGLGIVNRMRTDLSAIRSRNRVASLGSSTGTPHPSSSTEASSGPGVSTGAPQLAALSSSPVFPQVTVLPSSTDSQEANLAPSMSVSPPRQDRDLMPPPPAPSAGKLRVPNSPAGRKKEGILWVMGKSITGPAGADAPRAVNRSLHWREAWVVLSGSGHLSEYSEWKDGNKILSPSTPVIDLRFATVREARGVDRRFAFEVVTREHRRFFQASSDEAMQDWIRAISKAIESLINGTSSVRQVDKVASKNHKTVSPQLEGNVFDGIAEGAVAEADEWSGDENRRPKDVFDDWGGNGKSSTSSAAHLGIHRPWSQSLTDLGNFTSGISGMSPAKLFQRGSGQSNSTVDNDGLGSTPSQASKRNSRQGPRAANQQPAADPQTSRHSRQSSDFHNKRDSNVSSTMLTAASDAASSSGVTSVKRSSVQSRMIAGSTPVPSGSGSGGISNMTPVSGYVGLDAIPSVDENSRLASADPRPTHLGRTLRPGGQLASEGSAMAPSSSGWSVARGGSEQDFELDQRIEALVNSHYGSTSDLMNLAGNGSLMPSSPVAGTEQSWLHRLSGPRVSEGDELIESPSAHQRSLSIGSGIKATGSKRASAVAMGRTPTSASDKYARAAEITSLASKPGNAQCADCGDADPRWASWALNGVPSCVFICIRCSGMHRSLGVHISKVKSVDLDDWTEEQLQSARVWGNQRVNAIYEAKPLDVERPKPGQTVTKKDFWTKKYVECTWKIDDKVDASPPVPSKGTATLHRKSASLSAHLYKQRHRDGSTGAIGTSATKLVQGSAQ